MTPAIGFPGPFELILLAAIAAAIVVIVMFMTNRSRMQPRGFVVEERKEKP